MLVENHFLLSLETKVVTFFFDLTICLNSSILGDLQHLRAVKEERHLQFAKSKDMLSFFVSAKTGESIETLFRHVTAHLMHIVLPKTDQDATRVIRASIVRQEPLHSVESVGHVPKQTQTSVCTIY